MLHDLNTSVVGRLLVAAVLGGIVGLERELNHKPAGIRTNMLISLGAALFTVISYEMAGNVGGDHTRIAAQIIPGIEMFVHQAARQFEIWTGKPAPQDDMLQVVTLALQERANRAAVTAAKKK